MTTTTTSTLRQHVVHRLGRNLLNALLVAAAFVAVTMFLPTEMTMVPTAPAAPTERIAQVNPADLVERHGCWTGEAPADMAGVVPGHVVVSEPNQTPRHAGPAMVGKALGQIFEGQDHGLTVHAFCR